MTFSELLALAFGYEPEDFGMTRCRPIAVDRFIEKVKAITAENAKKSCGG